MGDIIAAIQAFIQTLTNSQASHQSKIDAANADITTQANNLAATIAQEDATLAVAQATHDANVKTAQAAHDAAVAADQATVASETPLVAEYATLISDENAILTQVQALPPAA